MEQESKNHESNPKPNFCIYHENKNIKPVNVSQSAVLKSKGRINSEEAGEN